MKREYINYVRRVIVFAKIFNIRVKVCSTELLSPLDNIIVVINIIHRVLFNKMLTRDFREITIITKTNRRPTF